MSEKIHVHPKHPFHLVDPSPWPIVAGLSALVLTIGAVLAMHKLESWTLYIGLVMLVASAGLWWRDVIRESNIVGTHNKVVRHGLRVGVVLFIASEVMFFAAFFWAYFHAALDPTEATGGVWPPKGIVT